MGIARVAMLTMTELACVLLIIFVAGFLLLLNLPDCMKASMTVHVYLCKYVAALISCVKSCDMLLKRVRRFEKN
jgi:competence protein ComGC